MDSVSFTGIKNIGVIPVVINNGDFKNMYRIVMQLTDEGIPHLSYAKKNFVNCPNKLEDGLQIDAFESHSRKSDAIYVNGQHVIPKSENLSFINWLSDLVKGISKKSNNELAISESYYYNDSFVKNSMPVLGNEPELFRDVTPNIVHAPENIRLQSNAIWISLQRLKEGVQEAWN